MNKRFSFEQLEHADLFIDAVYEASKNDKNIKGEPLHELFPKCGNIGGFRKVTQANSSKLAYVVLYTTMTELEWPDYLDIETGVFRYYGDNRNPGNNILHTKQKGNQLLETVFSKINSNKDIYTIPPFFVFKKEGSGRDVKFLGLAAPGNPNISPDKDLVAFWRTMKGNRFQNYEAYFTILDTKQYPIKKMWLWTLINDPDKSDEYAPECWKRFKKKGRLGIIPLKAPRTIIIPSKYEQLQSDNEGSKCIEIIRKYYRNNPYGFESCATKIISKMDQNFIDFSITRPWRDGGRDAVGYYTINAGGSTNFPLKIDCALEAKCYGANNSVGVKEMSRLISRIRYRQFGIMVTTSYINQQAYREIIEDGHPILVVTATDIARILRNNSIISDNIESWLDGID